MMRKFYVPLMLVLLPMLLSAGVFDGRGVFDFNSSQLGYRAWRMSQQLTSYKNGDAWVPAMNAIPHYNPVLPALPDSICIDAYDETEAVWIPSIMVSYLEYNAAGRVVSNVINMNMMGLPLPMMMETCSYDAQNRITGLAMFFADPEGPVYWVPSYRMHFIHLGGTAFEIYGWEDMGEEVKTSYYTHSTFSFDTQGRIIEELSYTSPDSTNWVQDYRTSYQYHPQDASTGADFIEYASANLSLMMMNDGFDFPGLITLSNSQLWNGSGWEPNYRTTYQYNGQLQRTQSLDEYYMTGLWHPEHQKLYYYDTSGQLSYTIGQSYDGDGFTDEERVDYTWQQYGSAADDPVVPAAQLTLRAWPSPFVEELTIQTDSSARGPVSVCIHNLRGQKIRELSSSGSGSIRWDGKDTSGREVPAGVYLLKAVQDDRSGVTKVLRLK